MANTIRIKRRTGGSAGAPSTLENAELAFNEVGEVLYYGQGTGGVGGSATSIIPIAGSGAFMDLSSTQTVAGTKTFSTAITGSVTGNAGTATALATGRTISISGDLTYTSPSFDGTGNVTAAGTLATVNSNIGTFTKITINDKGLATAGANAILNDIGAPTSSFSFGSQLLTSLADPVSNQDAATKYYVDSVAQGLDIKASVVTASTANIATLSGLLTVAGVTLTAGQRVLVKNQTASEDNGIYLASATAWSRSPDADTWDELVSAFVFVEEGTNADTGWVCTINAGGTLGTTPITWTQFSGAGTYTNGTGLTLTGNVFSITDTAVTPASYGSASKTLTATVNAQGQLTALADTSIAIANTQVSGLGTMSTQAASSVAITGGSIINLTTFDGITIDGGTF